MRVSALMGSHSIDYLTPVKLGLILQILVPVGNSWRGTRIGKSVRTTTLDRPLNLQLNSLKGVFQYSTNSLARDRWVYLWQFNRLSLMRFMISLHIQWWVIPRYTRDRQSLAGTIHSYVTRPNRHTLSLYSMVTDSSMSSFPVLTSCYRAFSACILLQGFQWLYPITGFEVPVSFYRAFSACVLLNSFQCLNPVTGLNVPASCNRAWGACILLQY